MYKENKDKIVRWLCWSAALGAITLILTQCSTNTGTVPISKNLWSITFITALSVNYNNF